MEKKRGELVAAQNELEKYRHQEKFLTSENEVLKVGIKPLLQSSLLIVMLKIILNYVCEVQVEMQTHRKRVTELEGELKKLSGQQNLHQRIHHHAKIKASYFLLPRNPDLIYFLKKPGILLYLYTCF